MPSARALARTRASSEGEARCCKKGFKNLHTCVSALAEAPGSRYLSGAALALGLVMLLPLLLNVSAPTNMLGLTSRITKSTSGSERSVGRAEIAGTISVACACIFLNMMRLHALTMMMITNTK